MSVMDLLRMRQLGAGGAAPNAGVLALLGFPQLQQPTPFAAPPTAQGFQPAQYPAQSVAPPAAAPPQRAPIALPPNFSAPSPQAQPQTQPQQRPPAHTFASMPAPQAPHADALPAMPEIADVPDAPAFNIRKPGFFERMNEGMGGSNITPLDGLALGAQLMGAGQASWNVDQPDGWTRAAEAIQGVRDRADERDWRQEQRGAFRAEQQRADETHQHDRATWGREDQQISAAIASIQNMPEGPEKQWAMAYPMEYARLQLANQAQRSGRAGEDVFEGDRHFRYSSDGRTLEYVGSMPLTEAQRAEQSLGWARVNRGDDQGPLTPNALAAARAQYAAMDRTNSQLAAVQQSLRGMTDAQLASQLGMENSAFLSQLTQLQMSLKDQYQLGALAGPDQALLRAVTGDPREFVSFLQRGGVRGMQGALNQVQTGVELNRNSWRTQYAPWGRSQGLADLFTQAPPATTQNAPPGATPGGASPPAGNATPRPDQEAYLRQHRDDPATIAAFVQEFGAEAAQRALHGGAQAPLTPRQQRQAQPPHMVMP